MLPPCSWPLAWTLKETTEITFHMGANGHLFEHVFRLIALLPFCEAELVCRLVGGTTMRGGPGQHAQTFLWSKEGFEAQTAEMGKQQ